MKRVCSVYSKKRPAINSIASRSIPQNPGTELRTMDIYLVKYVARCPEDRRRQTRGHAQIAVLTVSKNNAG